MISILLTVLKVLGILLLVLLGIVLLVLLLVLFVPLRYTLEAQRKEGSEEAFSVKAKITWMLHLLNIHARFPQTPYLKARVLCFTLFSTDKKSKEKPAKGKKSSPKSSEEKTKDREAEKEEPGKNGEKQTEPVQEQTSSSAEGESKTEQESSQTEKSTEFEPEEDTPTFFGFWKRIFSLFQNIRYTITQICDKIKHIIKNIRYYLEIIKSDMFMRAFGVSKSQIWKLLYLVRPRKIKGKLLIGTGDPASTGQVLAIYGILYPLLGDQVSVTPDFDRKIVVGELFVKGKVTVFWLVKAAWIIYFNKDLRRIIKMFKREAA